MARTTPLMIVALAVVAAVVAPVVAQEEGKYTLEGKEGGWEIEVLLAKLAELPDVNVTFDPHYPGIARRRIHIEGKVELGRSEFFDWIRALLFQNRLVLVPVGPETGGTYAVHDINSPNVCTHPVHVPEADLAEWADRDGAYIMTSVRLDHLQDTARARNSLAQMMTRQVGRVTDNPTTQSMVIADFAPAVVAMVKILEQLDEDASKADPAVVAAADPRIKQYEKLLASCHTESAAGYFIERILALMPKRK